MAEDMNSHMLNPNTIYSLLFFIVKKGMKYDLPDSFIEQTIKLKLIETNIYSDLIKLLSNYDQKNNTNYEGAKSELLIFNDKKKLSIYNFQLTDLAEYTALEKPISKTFDALIKSIKNHFRRTYGMFQTKHYSKVDRLLSDFDKNKDQILSSHSSTYERAQFYDEFYAKVNNSINLNNADTILDLGCGMNPVSYEHFNLTDKHIYLNEISKKDCDRLQIVLDHYKEKYFCEGEVICGSIFDLDFPEVDVCFMLKLLETLEITSWDYSKELLSRIKAKYIVVSFSTKTLSGKQIYCNREWFEKLIKDKHYEMFEIFNEIIYVVKNY